MGDVQAFKFLLALYKWSIVPLPLYSISIFMPFWNQHSSHGPSYLCTWRQPVSSTRRNKLPSSVWREVSVVTPDIKRLSEKKSNNGLVSKCFIELYWISVFIVPILSKLPESLLDLGHWSGKCHWLHVVRLLSEWWVSLLTAARPRIQVFQTGDVVLNIIIL